MKEKPIKTFLKWVILAVQQIAIVVLVISFFSAYLSTDSSIMDGRGNQYYISAGDDSTRFEETSSFYSIFVTDIAEVSRMAVIRSQLETDGQFDGQKVIDLASYVYRKQDIIAQDVTASFYLEDLLKWYRYGLEYEDVVVKIGSAGSSQVKVETQEQLEEYTVSSNDTKGKFYIADRWINQDIQWSSENQYFKDIFTDESGNTYGTVSMLKCRYQTIDGKNIDETVNNWTDYFTQLINLDIAIASLNSNYTEYVSYGKDFEETATNFRYCYRMMVDGEPVYFTNVEELQGFKGNENDISERFDNYGAFLFYYPGRIEYETNTSVSEETIFGLLADYQYAYPENTKVWIGVDTSYPVQSDVYARASEIYKNGLPDVNFFFTLMVVMGVILLTSMIFMTYKAGWKKDENGEAVLKLLNFDKIPTEIFVLGAGIVWVGFIYVTGIAGIFDWLFYREYYMLNNEELKVVLAVFTVAGVTAFQVFYYSFVRRCKAHSIFSNSLIGRCVNALKEMLKNVHKSKSVFRRTILPYVLFLCVNGMAVLFFLIGLFDNPIWCTLWFFGALTFDIFVGGLLTRSDIEKQSIVEGIEEIRSGNVEYQMDLSNMHGSNIIMAESVNNIGEGIRNAVETSMKDERLKADLITNVSHDIKTPLTSIINYVDLLKRENIADEKIAGYIDILEGKAQRLKQLTEDLVEASKISSGNISYIFERINFVELLHQAIGEFSEKFQQKNLLIFDNLEGASAYIQADSRRLWRVIENLFNNVYKYALDNTRVYLNIYVETIGSQEFVVFSMKNISAQPLNINADELTERFIRGDVSRSTEGSGLGLSIAKNLTEAQKGKFDIYLDGDLFKVTLTFPILDKETEENV